MLLGLYFGGFGSGLETGKPEDEVAFEMMRVPLQCEVMFLRFWKKREGLKTI